MRSLLHVLGYAAGFVLLLLVTFALVGIPPVTGLSGLWTGAVGNSVDGHWYALSETVVKMSPLLLTGLGIRLPSM